MSLAMWASLGLLKSSKVAIISIGGGLGMKFLACREVRGIDNNAMGSDEENYGVEPR